MKGWALALLVMASSSPAWASPLKESLVLEPPPISAERADEHARFAKQEERHRKAISDERSTALFGVVVVGIVMFLMGAGFSEVVRMGPGR